MSFVLTRWKLVPQWFPTPTICSIKHMLRGMEGRMEQSGDTSARICWNPCGEGHLWYLVASDKEQSSCQASWTACYSSRQLRGVPTEGHWHTARAQGSWLSWGTERQKKHRCEEISLFHAMALKEDIICSFMHINYVGRIFLQCVQQQLSYFLPNQVRRESLWESYCIRDAKFKK